MSKHQFPLEAREYIQWVFSPHVGVLCGEEAENTCLRNNLKFVDLLQPFCQLDDDVGISDTNGSLQTVRRLRVVLQDLGQKPPSPALAKKILSHVVTVNAEPASQDAVIDELPTPWYEKWREVFHQLLHPFDHEFTKHLIACIIVVSSCHGAKAGEEAQRLTHQQHQQQHQPSQHGSSKYPKWFSPNILKYYVVLHDSSVTSKEIGDIAYKSVSSSINASCSCYILSLNSGRPPDTPPLPLYWAPHTLLHVTVPGYTSHSVAGSECSSSPASPSEDYQLNSPTGGGSTGYQSPPHSTTPPLSDGESNTPIQTLPTPEHPLSPTLPSMEDAVGAEEVVVNVGDLFPTAGASAAGGVAEWGACLSVGDIDNVRQFVGSFVRGSLVPYVERQVRILTEVVTNRSRSKSLISATRRWLGGSKNPSSSSSTNTVLYSPEATELQTRRLADLAFMFGLYDTAYQAYHTAKNDFKSDQAWVYFSGAQEMAALALFMQSSAEFPKRYLENTWETLSTVCKATNLGIRLLLLACEVLKSNKCYGDAAMYYIKLTSEDSDLLSALMLEQAAACFLKSGHINKMAMRRKFAFHMTLAGHRYMKAGQKLLSLRANGFARKVYSGTGFVLAEDHLLFCIGKNSAQLKDHGSALAAYTQLIDACTHLSATSKQSLTQQTAYVREFMALYKLVESNHCREAATAAGGIPGPASFITGTGVDGPLPELPELPVPWLFPQECMLLLDSSSFNPAPEGGSSVPASGISFSHASCEHRETWLGLERLMLEKMFGAMARPANLQLLTAATDNTRPSLLPVGEQCWLKLALMNPLLVSFIVREARLKYRFIPDDNDTGEVGAEDVKHSVIETVVLAPSERKDLVFELCPSRLGRLVIEGVQYKLSLAIDDDSGAPSPAASVTLPLITGYQSFQVRGPRLNNNLKNRSTVVYAPDKRLELSVVPPLPRVAVQFTDLPERLLCGQVVQVAVRIINNGTIPVTGLHLACNDPQHVYFSTQQSTSSASRLAVPSSNSNAGSSDKCFSFDRVRSIALPADSLPVGGEVRGTLWLKGQLVVGLQHLLLLFYCHAPDERAKNRYRLLRHQSSMTVSASVGLSVRTASSLSVPSTSAEQPLDTRPGATSYQTTSTVEHNVANITVDVTASAEPGNQHQQMFSIVAISGHSRRWNLRHFSRGRKSAGDGCVLLMSGETARTSVQCYAAGDAQEEEQSSSSGNSSGLLSSSSHQQDLSSNSSIYNMFSLVSFVNNGCNDDSRVNCSFLTEETLRENNSECFSLRSRVKLPDLSSVAPPASPASDKGAVGQHPALVQYNMIRQANDLDMVLTIHWMTSVVWPSVAGASATDEAVSVYGQHSVVLSNIGETVTIALPTPPLPPSPPPPSLLSSMTPSIEVKAPPVRIIPVEPPVLPQIPTKFAASVGLDVSGGSEYPEHTVPGRGLNVMQATALAEKGEVNVTMDLSKEQLDNCLKVTADCQRSLSHDFAAQNMCRLSVLLLVHNSSDTALSGQLLLNAPRRPDDEPPATTGQQPPAAPLPTSAASALRYVGCVTRNISLPRHSQARVPCQALVTAAGTYTLGRVALTVKTDAGIKFDRQLVLEETVVVADASSTWRGPH